MSAGRRSRGGRAARRRSSRRPRRGRRSPGRRRPGRGSARSARRSPSARSSSARSRRRPPGSSSAPAGRTACGRPRGGTGSRRSPRSTDSNAATGEAVEEASGVNPGGAREHGVAVRHPARLLGRRPRQQPARLRNRQLRAPELADLGALDPSAELARDQLHPVTDAEHGDAELQQLAVERRRSVGDTPRPGRRTGSRPWACAGPPPRRRRGGAAARRRRRTRARGGRSAASTARRSRGQRPPQ